MLKYPELFLEFNIVITANLYMFLANDETIYHISCLYVIILPIFFYYKIDNESNS